MLLGLISLSIDLVFLFQHYVLYRRNRLSGAVDEEYASIDDVQDAVNTNGDADADRRGETAQASTVVYLKT